MDYKMQLVALLFSLLGFLVGFITHILLMLVYHVEESESASLVLACLRGYGNGCDWLLSRN